MSKIPILQTIKTINFILAKPSSYMYFRTVKYVLYSYAYYNQYNLNALLNQLLPIFF